MARKMRRKTRDPIATALLIELLNGYSTGTLGNSPAQVAFKRSLEEVDPDRIISQRLMSNFSRVNKRHRDAVFNGLEFGRYLKLNDSEMYAVLSKPPLSVFIIEDDVLPTPIPAYPVGTNFTILYTGLYCNDDSDDGFIFRGSDEPYVITVALEVLNGENITRSERHPIGFQDGHYNDVDSGEHRDGPNAACWSGELPAIELSLISTVMENDEGDPNAYKEEIEVLVNVAAAIAAAFNIAVGVAIKAFVEDILLWLVDSGDDELGTDVAIITPDQLRRYPHQYPLRRYSEDREIIRPNPFPWDFPIKETVTDETSLMYHFVTQHEDSGRYVATYKVVADQEPLPDSPFPVFDAGRLPNRRVIR
ncbi:MAG: hypothetical protein JAZ13_09170 [Candidatus Thiodiazotropha taylori]|nr:hypothetical protein [Candidatus Thiodiazotropha taylori]